MTKTPTVPKRSDEDTIKLILVAYNSFKPYGTEYTSFDSDEAKEVLSDFSGENQDFKIVSDISGADFNDGEEFELVSEITIKATGELIYIAFIGSYSSWDSSSWEGVKIVKPTVEQVIKYV